jgi:hypothetical protein
MEEITAYIDALIIFLTKSPAGAAYRALLGEAQHDRTVGELLRNNDVLGQSAAAVIGRALPGSELKVPMTEATALLIGTAFFWIVSGQDPEELDTSILLRDFFLIAGAKRGDQLFDPKSSG